MSKRRSAVVILVAALAAGCQDDDGETLRFSMVEACVRPRTSSEQVFRSAADWQAFYQTNGGLGTAPAVDFGSSLLAARFDGPGSACVGFTVEGVEVGDGRVLIRATRHNSPNPCVAVIAYPQLLVTVEARDLPVEFEIRTARDQVPGQAGACM